MDLVAIFNEFILLKFHKGYAKYKWCKEGSFLFNNILNTYYLLIYGIRYMVKDHSAKEETHCHHYYFWLAARVHIYMHHPTDRIAHIMVFVTPVMVGWFEREITQWAHHEGSIRRPIKLWADALPQSYVSGVFVWLLQMPLLIIVILMQYLWRLVKRNHPNGIWHLLWQTLHAVTSNISYTPTALASFLAIFYWIPVQ